MPFRILSVDGGGVRGLIPALLLQDLEARLRKQRPDATLTDHFDLFVGTSTGGLIVLGLTAPTENGSGPRMNAAKLVDLYRGRGPEIFKRSLLQKLRTLWGWTGPKYGLGPLGNVLSDELGPGRLADALRDLVVVSYDMATPGPQFFKRWQASASTERNPTLVDVGLASSAAPTYFPALGLDGGAFVDGGVFAANPTIAGVAEALKRTTDPPAPLTPQDLLVVSLGTGRHIDRYSERQVRGWGKLGWIWPRASGPALLEAVFDGQSRAADHWAHMLLNHQAGQKPDPEFGRGPRYWRFEPELPRPYGLDDASTATLDALTAAAQQMIQARAADLDALARLLETPPKADGR
jgi:patatin-like phospholipase/acyl hydrolase